MNKVTLADIAKKTGFSVNTISHALKDKPDISEKTKKYINDTATDMGYIPNISAGVLRGGKTMSVAIIVSDISNPYFAVILKEMELYLQKLGYTAIIINSQGNAELEKKAVISALSKNVDGIIICPTDNSKENLKFIENNALPYISFSKRISGKNKSFVITDEKHTGFITAKHLIELGHRKILFLSGEDFTGEAEERISGIKEAFSESAISESNIFTSKVNSENDIKKALSENYGYSAVICFDDIIATNACHLLNKEGKAIPDEISVVGFGNLFSQYNTSPLLTTVDFSKAEMAVKTVSALIDIINEKLPSVQTVLTTEIIYGDTSQEVSRKYRESLKRGLSDYLL